jgi:hypothetical protein
MESAKVMKTLQYYGGDARGFARNFLANTITPQFAGRTSKLAESIVYLGED